MTREERQFCEWTKKASKIQLIVNAGEPASFKIELNSSQHQMKKFAHDIGIALQDYFIKRQMFEK